MGVWQAAKGLALTHRKPNIWLAMDYKQLLEQRQNQSIFEFYRQNPQKPPNVYDNQDRLHRAIGGMSVFMNGRLIVDPTGAYSTAPTGPPAYTSQSQILRALDTLLSYNASISLGPTLCARMYYLWFFSIAIAVTWTTSKRYILGTKDSWNWSTQHILGEDDQLIWITHILAEIMPSFVPTYDSSQLLALEREHFSWTIEQQTTEWTRISADDHFP